MNNESEITRCKNDILYFVEKYVRIKTADGADDGAEYQFDEDFEELEILNSMDDVKEILEGINEFGLDEF